jgi:pimeloyl-ACP methyl ester carboxylesterase
VRAAIFMVGCGNFSKYAAAYLSVNVKLMQSDIELTDTERAMQIFQAMAPSMRWGDDAGFDAIVAMSGMFVFADRNGEQGQNLADLAWAQEDHIAELRDLQVPALAIANEWDWIFPPALVRRAVEQMPDAEMVQIAEATHIGIDTIEETPAAVLDFLSRRAAPVGESAR